MNAPLVPQHAGQTKEVVVAILAVVNLYQIATTSRFALLAWQWAILKIQQQARHLFLVCDYFTRDGHYLFISASLSAKSGVTGGSGVDNATVIPF